jgi:hypothetical protein
VLFMANNPLEVAFARSKGVHIPADKYFLARPMGYTPFKGVLPVWGDEGRRAACCHAAWTALGTGGSAGVGGWLAEAAPLLPRCRQGSAQGAAEDAGSGGEPLREQGAGCPSRGPAILGPPGLLVATGSSRCCSWLAAESAPAAAAAAGGHRAGKAEHQGGQAEAGRLWWAQDAHQVRGDPVSALPGEARPAFSWGLDSCVAVL